MYPGTRTPASAAQPQRRRASVGSTLYANMASCGPASGTDGANTVGSGETSAGISEPAKSQARPGVGPRSQGDWWQGPHTVQGLPVTLEPRSPADAEWYDPEGRSPDHVTRARPPSCSAVLVFRAQRLTGGVAFASAALRTFAACPLALPPSYPSRRLSLPSPSLQTWLTSRTPPNMLHFSLS